MTRFDGVEHRPVERIQFLVAASARTRVENRIFSIAVKIRVASINQTEIS